MRKTRRETLARTGLFHKMWKGHNHQPVLEDPADKRSYVGFLIKTYTDAVRAHVQWFSFCLMTNHVHETGGLIRNEDGELETAITTFSTWMKNGHGQFGQAFNRRHGRSGKVANDRPATPEIDDDRGVLQVMFYGDVNPVRAGMVSHPSRYEHSSYRLYAFGEQSELTAGLTPPPAYLALGETPAERQRSYRSLCDAYMRREGLIDDRPDEDVEPPHDADHQRAAPVQEPRARGDPPIDRGDDLG